MSEYLKYDPHGHSSFSDGQETPEEIVVAAAGRVDYLGLSDHNTVVGVPRFLSAVKRINDKGIPLIGVPSVEISTSIGHMILAVSDPAIFGPFLRWGENTEFIGIHPSEVILPGVRDFNGTCIFTHPGVPFTEGADFQELEKLLNGLPPDVHDHIAVETDNHSAHILPNYAGIRERTHAWNRQFGLAEIAGSDAHTKHLSGRFFSLVPATDGEPIVDAVKNKTLITPNFSVGLQGKLGILLYHGPEYFKHKIGISLNQLRH